MFFLQANIADRENLDRNLNNLNLQIISTKSCLIFVPNYVSLKTEFYITEFLGILHDLSLCLYGLKEQNLQNVE